MVAVLFVVAPSILSRVVWPGQIPSCRLPVCVNADVTKFGACLLTGAGFPFLDKKQKCMFFGRLEKSLLSDLRVVCHMHLEYPKQMTT